MADEMTAGSPGKLAVARDFLIETRAEMDRVSWPERPELIKATRAVLIGAVVLGVAIGIVDKILQLILVDFVSVLSR